MSRPGRNDPCHCGSGKKYKKCHLAHDEEQEHQERARLVKLAAEQALSPWTAGPRTSASNPRTESNEVWNRFTKLTTWDQMTAYFHDTLASGELTADDAVSILGDMRYGADTLEEQADVHALMAALRERAPNLYEESIGEYNGWLIEEAMARGDEDDLPVLLEPLSRRVREYSLQLDWITTALLYHGYSRPVHDALWKAWPILRTSPHLKGTENLQKKLVSLTLFEYVQSTPTPDAGDPSLYEALGTAPYNRETIALAVRSVSGQARPLTLDDFSSSGDYDVAMSARLRLSLAWLGTLHRRHGVPLARAELSRDLLLAYLAARADDGATGATLLLPHRALLAFLEYYLVSNEAAEFAVASLIEYLPLYVDYLAEHDLAPSERMESARAEVWVIQKCLLELFESEGHSALASDLRQRLSIDPSPLQPRDVRDPTGRLTELIEAGEHPDRRLLDEVKGLGDSAVPALIQIATDDGLHLAGRDTAWVWAPLHAVKLLGEMHAEEAVGPLLPLLTWDDEDYLIQELVAAFGLIGPPAFGPLRNVCLDATQTRWTRIRAADCLVALANHNRNLRDGVVATLLEVLDLTLSDPLGDAELLGFIISNLADIGATEALPMIRRAYREDRVDEFIIDLDGVEHELRRR